VSVGDVIELMVWVVLGFIAFVYIVIKIDDWTH
jgi:hypothetical protein